MISDTDLRHFQTVDFWLIGLTSAILWLRYRKRTAAIRQVRNAARVAPAPTREEWMDHAKYVHERDAKWKQERKQWEENLDKHLRYCERQWRADGWLPKVGDVSEHPRTTTLFMVPSRH